MNKTNKIELVTLEATFYPWEQKIFFWRGIFSQWKIRSFLCTALNETVNCSEQAMMLSKAKLFEDTETYEAIKLTSIPKEQKALGRKVKNFDEEKWKQYCYKIVTDINYDKFSQHQDWKEILLLTYPHTLVEASPYDRIWGIGMDVNDPNLLDTRKWGENLLGRALMQARENIINS